MGMFDVVTEDQDKKAIEKALGMLKQRDGKIHIICMNTNQKLNKGSIGVDERTTNNVDDFINAMQDKGYEIIDVKIIPSHDGAIVNRFVQILYK